MREFATILTVTGVILWTGGATLADTVVVEELTGSAGDWTYTYTLTNGEASDIWHWCVWFPSNPNSNLVTAGTANWSATNLATHGFFPEEYTAAWGCHVYDSAGIDLVGPSGEPGFFGTWSSDYTSANPGEYWDGDSWEPLPDPLPDWPDPIYDAIWRGEDYGWNGSGANIQTSYAIGVGGTGNFSVHSSAQDAVTNQKSFSFSTTDYWYSFFDGTDDHLDFEGSGTVVPEPGTVVLLVCGLAALPFGAVLRRRRRRP